MRVYSTDYGLGKTRGIDYLIDDDLIHKGDVLFVIEDEISPQYDLKFAARGLFAVYLKDFLWKAPWRAYLESLKYLLKGPKWMYRYILWAGLLAEHSFGSYVVYNDLPRENEVRTRMMQDRDIPVYWITHSMNNWHEFLGHEKEKEPETADVYADEVIVWNTRQMEWWTYQTEEVSGFHVTGCPWSELIARHRRGRKPGRVVIGFGTTIGPTCDALEAARFSTDIHSLELNVDVGGVTYVRFKDKADSQDALLMVAGADLVIGYPFSSVVIEALQAGVPAIFYDPTGRWPPSGYPSILYAGPGQLTERVKKVLEEPQLFLSEVRRCVMYGPWDAKGLTRIRKIILQRKQFNDAHKGVGYERASEIPPQV